MTAIEANARYVLLAILAEIETFADVPDELIDGPDLYVLDMLHRGVPFRPAQWVGAALPPARRMAFSRATRRLEGRGLVRRVTERRRDRVRYLVPTPEGLRRSLALAESADKASVGSALTRTRWGRPLADQLNGGTL